MFPMAHWFSTGESIFNCQLGEGVLLASGLPRWLSGYRNLPAMKETQVWSLGQEDPLEEGIATHPSILAWRIPGTEEPGGLHSIGSQRVRHD